MALIAEDETQEAISVPVDDGDSIPLNILERYFDGAAGLMYFQGTEKRPVSFDKSVTKLIPPEGGWSGKLFYVVRSRSRPPTIVQSRPTMPQLDEEEFAESLHHLLYFMPRNQPALRDPKRLNDPSLPKPNDYVDGGCVTPISQSTAVTYQHRSHKFLHVYSEGSTSERSIVEIRKTLDTNVRHIMKVIAVDELHDFVLIRSLDNSGIFDYSYPWSLRCPKKFEWFVGFGLSHRTGDGRHVTHTSGRICSDKPDYRGRYKADSAIDAEDSGGPCFAKDRALIGIIVSSTTSLPNLSGEYQKGIVETEIGSASCHPGDSLIVPGAIICAAYEEYLVSTGEQLVGGETNPLERDVLKRHLLQSENEPSAKNQI